MDDTARRMSGEAQRPSNEAITTAQPVENADDGRRTEQIRHDIEHTREEMAETIDAIQEKLRPSNIVANATESVKEAATERIRAMTDTASDAAQTMMNRTRDGAGGFMETIKDNPYPAALIGIGLAWLMMSPSRSRHQYSYGDDGEWRRRYEGGARRYDRQYEGQYGRQSGYQSGDQSSEQGYGQKIAESAEGLASRAKDYAGETSRAIRSTGRFAQNRFQRMMTQNPLLVGAGALLVGAAFGLAVPETDMENEWMGEARDSVIDRAQEMVGDTAQKLQQTASNVADAAGGVADTMSRP